MYKMQDMHRFLYQCLQFNLKKSLESAKFEKWLYFTYLHKIGWFFCSRDSYLVLSQKFLFGIFSLVSVLPYQRHVKVRKNTDFATYSQSSNNRTDTNNLTDWNCMHLTVVRRENLALSPYRLFFDFGSKIEGNITENWS